MAGHDHATHPANSAGVRGLHQGFSGAVAKAHDTPGMFFLEGIDTSGNTEVTYFWRDGDGNIRYSTTIPTNQDTAGTVLGSAKGQVQTKVIPITTGVTGEQTGLWTIPDPSIILDVFIKVTTADTSETIDIGTDGAGSNDPDGFVDGLSLNALGVLRPTLLAGAVTLGVLLKTDINGTLFVREPAIIAGVAALTYTPSGTPSTAVGEIYVRYIDLS